MNNIESKSQKLLISADPNFAEQLKSQVDILVGKWKKVVEGAKGQNVRLKDALEKSKKVCFDFNSVLVNIGNSIA